MVDQLRCSEFPGRSSSSDNVDECAMASQRYKIFGVKNYPHIDSHWSPLLSVVHEKDIIIRSDRGSGLSPLVCVVLPGYAIVLLLLFKLRSRVLNTYLWVKLVDTSDRIVNVTTLDGASNDHAVQNAIRVDKRLEAALFAEAVGCILVAFDDEVVHHESVKVTVWGKSGSTEEKVVRIKVPRLRP